MEAITNIEIDLTFPRPYGPWVYAVQGDGNTRQVTVTLLSGKRPWSVPEGAEVAVEYQQPGGTKGLYNLLPDGTPAIHAQGNRVAVILAAPMLSEPGDVRTAIVINNRELDQLTTFPFTVTVKANAFALGQKAEDYIRLHWLENKLDECLMRAKDSGLFDGPKGEAFTYEDFTPEQLAALTGPQGPAGDNSAAVQAAEAANAAAASANTTAAAAQAAAGSVTAEVIQLRNEITAEANRAKAAEDNRIKKFYTSNMGGVNITDSDDGAVRNLVIGGNCVQADNPSPDNPQEIRWATNVTMTVSQAERTQRQTAPVPFILRGLSNVWDALYVYADGTGKFVQRIDSALFDGSEDWEAYTTVNNDSVRRYGTRVLFGKQKAVDNAWISNAMCSIAMPISANVGYAGNLLGFSVNGDGMTSFYVPSADFPDVSSWTTYLQANPVSYVYELKTPIETVLSKEQVTNLFALRTYCGGTNITFESESGVNPVVNFDYACSLENFVEYIKTAQGDTRNFIYDMEDRMTDVEYMAAMAYVNSEYAVAITELEV